MFSALCRLEKLSVIAMGNKKKNLSDMFFVNVSLNLSQKLKNMDGCFS